MSKETILNIPNPPNRNRIEPEPQPEVHHDPEDVEDEEFGDDEEEEGIGEVDDGKSGKLTLTALLQEGLVRFSDVPRTVVRNTDIAQVEANYVCKAGKKAIKSAQNHFTLSS